MIHTRSLFQCTICSTVLQLRHIRPQVWCQYWELLLNKLFLSCSWNFALGQMVILQLGKHTKFCHEICWMKVHYVSLLLTHNSETYLKELSFTHTISVKYYSVWFITCGFIKVFQLLLHNSLQILNYLGSGRLQPNLNVVFECFWIMTCTYLSQ